MKISPIVVFLASSVVSPVATAFLGDAINVMLPWLITMCVVVLADLAAGVRKSIKLKVHVSWTTAARETMGKMVVYLAFVLAVAMVDAAADGDALIARWVCLFVCTMEGGSILSNYLKPYGINLTPKAIAKIFLKRSPLAVSDEEADELLEEARKQEDKKWNHKGRRKHDEHA